MDSRSPAFAEDKLRGHDLLVGSRLRGNYVASRGNDAAVRGNDPFGDSQISNFDFPVSVQAHWPPPVVGGSVKTLEGTPEFRETLVTAKSSSRLPWRYF